MKTKEVAILAGVFLFAIIITISCVKAFTGGFGIDLPIDDSNNSSNSPSNYTNNTQNNVTNNSIVHSSNSDDDKKESPKKLEKNTNLNENVSENTNNIENDRMENIILNKKTEKTQINPLNYLLISNFVLLTLLLALIFKYGKIIIKK